MSSYDADSYHQRMTLICKPEQSGKTFIMIQQIIRDFMDPTLTMRVINIILCDNNLLLTKQTSERVGKDFSPLVEVNGESYLEFSSHSRTEYRCAVAVEGAISVQDIRNILCCTNGTRVDDIYTIIRDLNNSEINKDKFFFKIWLDEADKYTGFIDTTFLPLVEKYENVAVYCITATPKKLFTHYHSLNVFPLENTTSPEYHGWTDNILRKLDINLPCVGFAEYVLDNMGKEYIQPGTKWYIPADYKKKTHIAMKDVCVKRKFAVIIVNGCGIKLYLPDLEIIEFKKDDELNTIIKRIYDRYELHKYPLAITGNVCIGRGISIMSKDFMIDFAILSSCYNQQEASQNAGRVKGNIKAWSTYKKPMVFTTEKFNKIAEEWEEKSRGLARLAFDKKLLGKSTIISKNEYKAIGENVRYKQISYKRADGLIGESAKKYLLEWWNDKFRTLHPNRKKINAPRKKQGKYLFDKRIVTENEIEKNIKDDEFMDPYFITREGRRHMNGRNLVGYYTDESGSGVEKWILIYYEFIN